MRSVIAKFLALALGVGLLLLVLRDADFAQLGELISQAGIVGILIVIVVYAVAFFGDSVSWLLIITSLPVNAGWSCRIFVVRLVGEAFNNVVPAGGFAGEPVKAIILKSRYGMSFGESTASIVMARTVNMIALIAFLIIGFMFVLGAGNLGELIEYLSLVGLVVLTFGTVLLFLVQRFRISSRLLLKISHLRWGQNAKRFFDAIDELDSRFVAFYSQHGKRLAWSLLLAFGNWVLGVVEVYLAFYFLGHEITWAEAWMIEALVQMIRSAVFFVPLAVGAQEGTFLMVVTALTGIPALGLAIAAVRRIREIAWIGLGLCVGAAIPVRLRTPG